MNYFDNSNPSLSYYLDNSNFCDKYDRPITCGKGYILIDGWRICGICQYEDSLKNQIKNENRQGSKLHKL